MAGYDKNFTPYKDDWNMNKGFLDELTRMINLVNQTSAAGDILLWFNNLRTLYRNAAPFIRKRDGCKDEKELDAMFHAVRQQLPQLPKTANEKVYFDVRMNKVRLALDELNIELIRSMHTNRLIMPMGKDDFSKAALEFN
jgi:hypothetical protein